MVLVCDARKGLLLTNQGDADLPDLRIIGTLEAAANPSTAVQGTDRPGRAAVGTHRSAMDQTDWHQLAEDEFAAELAAWLADHHRNKPHATIVIVAAPKLMGDLRKHLPGEVAGKIAREIAKDLVNLPTDQLERALVGG
jgi:protein required for attachment to host cells